MTTKPETDKAIIALALHSPFDSLSKDEWCRIARDCARRVEELEAVVNRPVGDVPVYDILHRALYDMNHPEKVKVVKLVDHIAAMRGREASAEGALVPANVWKWIADVKSYLMEGAESDGEHEPEWSKYQKLLIQTAPTPPGATNDE